MNTPGSPTDLSALYEERRKDRDQDISRYNEVEAAIRGELPQEYQALFTESDVKLQLRTIRAADDSLTKFLAEIPILPSAETVGKRDSDKAKNKAELVEKVCFGYYNGASMRGGTSFPGIRFQLARYQVRFGDGCVLVHPDFNRRLVFLEVKDPRCFYPPTGWTPWSISPLDGALLVYEMTLGEVKRRYAVDEYGGSTDIMGQLDDAFSDRYSSDGDDSTTVKVGMYRSKEAWYLATLNGKRDVILMRSETGDKNHPGVCGVASFKQFSSEPLFMGQIGIEAYLEKVANQQVQNTERINKASLVGPPLVNDEFRVGGYSTIDFTNPLAQRFGPPVRLAPDSPGNLNQVMLTFLNMAQLFNYNPESSMGGGDAVSGKAINALQAGPRTHVTNILWTPYEVAFPRLHDEAMSMELNLWPNEKKTTYGSEGKRSFEVDYTPSAALQGYVGRVKIEQPRAGGYNAFLEALQKYDAGLIDLDSVLEADPDIRDVHHVKRRIEQGSVEKYVSAAFEAFGTSDPPLAIRASMEVLKRIESGKSKSQAIQEVIESGMLTPPEPDPMAAMGGLPPELMGAMGEEPMPPGSLTSARGY